MTEKSRGHRWIQGSDGPPGLLHPTSLSTTCFLFALASDTPTHQSKRSGAVPEEDVNVFAENSKEKPYSRLRLGHLKSHAQAQTNRERVWVCSLFSLAGQGQNPLFVAGAWSHT